jgi:phosphotransferase system IIB component
MSKEEKRETRIRQNPRNVSIVDFEALINQYGYIKFGGGHPQAIIGMHKYAYKRTNPVKLPYVEYLLILIDESKAQKE